MAVGSLVSPDMGESLFQLYVSLKELYQLGPVPSDRWATSGLKVGFGHAGRKRVDKASPCLPQAKPLLSPAMESWPWMVSTTGSSQPSPHGCRRLTVLPWSVCSVLCRWTRCRRGPRFGSEVGFSADTSRPIEVSNHLQASSSGHCSGQLCAKYGLLISQGSVGPLCV